MYTVPRQSALSLETPASELLADKSGELFRSLQDSLMQARQEVGLDADTLAQQVGGMNDTQQRLFLVFDAAEQIMGTAQTALRR